MEKWGKCQEPDVWTWRHSLYFTLAGVIGPTIICFGVNFGVAVAVFKDADQATMWTFPLPVSGDLGMIILVQQLINYNVVGSLSTFDVLNGLCPPLLPGYLLGIENMEKMLPFLKWLFLPPELLLPPIDLPDKSVKDRLFDTQKRALVWAIITFILVWPLFCGVTSSIWGNGKYSDWALPQFLSAVMGGIVALATIPLWTLLSLRGVGQRIVADRAQGSIADVSHYNNPVAISL
jgi:hypothetical protein